MPPSTQLITFAQSSERWVRVHCPLFDLNGAGTHAGAVPVREVQTLSGPVIVTTVFDLLAAHLGVRRREKDAHQEAYPSGYGDPQAYSPAWQEAITGVPAADAIRVAREFAENAEKTRGKSMIFLGASTNHWYHSDMIYRAILNLTTLCGCQGVNGGGWAHYVSQEKVRTQSAWSKVAWHPLRRDPQGAAGRAHLREASPAPAMGPAAPGRLEASGRAAATGPANGVRGRLNHCVKDG